MRLWHGFGTDSSHSRLDPLQAPGRGCGHVRTTRICRALRRHPRRDSGEQRNLVTIWQLRALGLASGTIYGRVASAALRRVHRGVYTVSPAPLSAEAEELAVVLACGPGVNRLTAAKRYGVSRFPAPLIEVVSPRRRRITGARVHRCRSLDPRDLTEIDGIPITTMHRLLVDLSDVLTSHQLANVIHEAAYRGRYVEAAVRDVMARMNGRHKLATLRRAMELHRMGSAGTRSGAEARVPAPRPSGAARQHAPASAARSTSTGPTTSSPSRSTASTAVRGAWPTTTGATRRSPPPATRSCASEIATSTSAATRSGPAWPRPWGGGRTRPPPCTPPTSARRRRRTPPGGGEIGRAHERQRVRGAPVAVHAGVLPLDRERALVADPVQRAEQVLEVDVAVAGGDEVPAARLLAEVQVPAEDRAAAVEALDRVLDVHVVDAVGELGHERGAVEELVLEVRGVEVDPEALAVVECVQRLARGHEVVGDLGGVDLERELHALGVEDVDDRRETLGELLVAALDDREVVGREGVQEVPDRRAGEARHRRHAEPGGRAGGVLELVRGALADALGVAVAPDVRRHDALVAARRSGRRPPGPRGGCRSSRPRGHGARATRACRARRRRRRARRRRRSGRPSRRARGRRSPRRRPSRRAR